MMQEVRAVGLENLDAVRAVEMQCIAIAAANVMSCKATARHAWLILVTQHTQHMHPDPAPSMLR
jgi:hypothetical protein